MRFSAFLINAAIVVVGGLLDKAATFQRREISKPVKVCLAKLREASTELTTVEYDLDAFASGSGYFTSFSVQTKEQTLDGLLSELCRSNLGVNFSDEETDSSTEIISPMIGDTIDLLRIVGNKKPNFDDAPLTLTLVKNDIKNTERHTRLFLSRVS